MAEEASTEDGKGSGGGEARRGKTRRMLGVVLPRPRHAQATEQKDLKELRSKVKGLTREQRETREALATRVEESERRLAALEEARAEAETMRSDHVAITRRLAAIEDRLRGAVEREGDEVDDG